MKFAETIELAKKLNRCMRVAGLLPLAMMAACQFVPSKSAAPADTPAEVPAAAQAAFDSALSAQRTQQWPEAERQLKQLAEKYPQLAGPHVNLALLYAQTQRPQLAEDSFKRALQINPKNGDAHNQYGVWLRSQVRFGEAETQYQQALALDADNAAAHLNLGILYDLYMGKLPQALEHYQRYLELSGDEKSPVQSWIADLQRRMKAE